MKYPNEFREFLKLLISAGDDLIRNKRAAGRAKDLRDLEELE